MQEKVFFLIINYESVITINLLLNSFYSNQFTNADRVQNKANKKF